MAIVSAKAKICVRGGLDRSFHPSLLGAKQRIRTYQGDRHRIVILPRRAQREPDSRRPRDRAHAVREDRDGEEHPYRYSDGWGFPVCCDGVPCQDHGGGCPIRILALRWFLRL